MPSDFITFPRFIKTDDKIYKLSDDRQASKYLGVLEADNIKNEEMRQIIEEYYR